LEQLADELRSSRRDLATLTIPADLANPGAPKRVVETALERFGRIDILINNAGFGLPTLFSDSPPDQLARQVAVNLTAPMMLAWFALPSLKEHKGMIINIGSAITCVANSALGAYGATKAGLAYWNDALRRELYRTGVRVCLVEPGPIKTEFMDALNALLPPGESPHPIIDNAAPWMTADVEEVARRVAGLFDHPRRRLSLLKRLVWPFRVLGVIARVCPPLGDRVVVMLQRKDPRSATRPT
jgi:short-subunit dehydrogenase